MCGSLRCLRDTAAEDVAILTRGTAPTSRRAVSVRKIVARASRLPSNCFSASIASSTSPVSGTAVPDTGLVDEAIEALKQFEGSREALATIFLTDTARRLVGAVPLVKIATSSAAVSLRHLSEPHISCAPDTPQAEVA